MEMTTLGFDLAEHVFQVHGAGAAGTVLVKQRLHRGQMAAFGWSPRSRSRSKLPHRDRRIRLGYP